MVQWLTQRGLTIDLGKVKLEAEGVIKLTLLLGCSCSLCYIHFNCSVFHMQHPLPKPAITLSKAVFGEKRGSTVSVMK